MLSASPLLSIITGSGITESTVETSLVRRIDLIRVVFFEVELLERNYLIICHVRVVEPLVLLIVLQSQHLLRQTSRSKAEFLSADDVIPGDAVWVA